MSDKHGARANELKFRNRSRGVSRIEAFSDVVFGFSLTLLVVSLEVPHTFTDLLSDMRGFVPFAVCFALFAQVWWLHHNFFRRYGLDDIVTATLNFILLFVVLFYTYPLKFLFTGIFNQLTGHEEVRDASGKMIPWIQPQQASTLMIIYGLGYATLLVIFVLLYWNALRQQRELRIDADRTVRHPLQHDRGHLSGWRRHYQRRYSGSLTGDCGRTGGLHLFPDSNRHADYWHGSRQGSAET